MSEVDEQRRVPPLRLKRKDSFCGSVESLASEPSTSRRNKKPKRDVDLCHSIDALKILVHNVSSDTDSPLKSLFFAVVDCIEALSSRPKLTSKKIDVDLDALRARQTALEAELAEHKEKIAALDVRLGELNGAQMKSVETISELRVLHESNRDNTETFYRDRSVVVKGLSYIQNPNPHMRTRALRDEIGKMLAFLGIPYVPVDVFFMGRHLVKVRFGTRRAKEELLQRAPRLRGSGWSGCFIRPSLLEEQRVQRAENLKLARERADQLRSEGQSVRIRSLPDWLNFEVVQAKPRRHTQFGDWVKNQ